MAKKRAKQAPKAKARKTQKVKARKVGGVRARKAERAGKAKKPVAKKAPSATRRSVVSKAAAKVKKRMLGKVIHYYDRIGVAIVNVASPIRLGDIVKLRRGEEELVQPVTSMQIEHQPVDTAKKGDVIGLKVTREVHEGTLVLPA